MHCLFHFQIYSRIVPVRPTNADTDVRGHRGHPVLNIQPKVANDGHRMIVDTVIPILREVMQDEKWGNKTPLLQARESLRRLDLAGGRFWGENQQYSRKRTVEDIVVSRYHSEVVMTLM